MKPRSASSKHAAQGNKVSLSVVCVKGTSESEGFFSSFDCDEEWMGSL